MSMHHTYLAYSKKNMGLPNDIENKIEEDLSNPEDRELVRSLLSGLGVNENFRVIRCILFATNGDLDRFGELETLAHIDYRDVTMAGEYERVSDKKLRISLNLFHNK